MIEQCGEFAAVVTIGAAIGALAALATYIILTKAEGALGHAFRT